MRYGAWLQCIKGCEEHYEISQVVYRCRHCGSLLEVGHDMEALKRRTAEAWMKLFDERYLRNRWPFGSAVWGKKEWVCPTVQDQNVVSMFEGGSNLYWADRLGQEIGLEDLWVKQCGNSHTGSFKDLGMTVLVSVVKQMISEGAPIRAVACASTGDTSAALSAYCAAAGIPSIVILPRNKVSVGQLVQPISNGSLVLSLNTDFDGCMKVVQELTADNTIYLANSMNSLRLEGQKTVAIELVQQFDWEAPDWVVIPGGNLGNVSALGRGFAMMRELGVIDHLPRIAVAQAERANPLYQSFQKGFADFQSLQAQATAASAIQIGNPVSVDKAIQVLREFDGVVEQASEDELANASARADRTGMYCCPHTGVALASLFKLIDKGVIKKNERVIVISTAHGLKFTEFKVRYHENRLDQVKPLHANLPEDLEPDLDAVRRCIDTRIQSGA